MIKMEFNTRYNIKDKNIAKIFTFFVIETPVSNVSYRSVTFKERNINMSKLTHDIKNEIEDFKNVTEAEAYEIKLKWTYKNDDKFQKEATVVVVKDSDKLSVAKLSDGE